MSRIIVQCIFLIVYFVHLDCEVYQDRPKIKTSGGDLIIEPAFDKNIYLLPNGPKSNVFVGEVNILTSKSPKDSGQYQPSAGDDIDKVLNGPNGILQRLDRLENKDPVVPSDLFLNISTLWRKVNNLNRKLLNLQLLLNNRNKDECQSRPCQHGGTCLNLVNGYHCLCPSNWEGTDCDVDVNECRNFAGTDLGCQNGATCINRPGTYECFCRSGWFGLHCTRKAKDCEGGDFEMCGYGTCIPVTTGEGIKCICHQGWMTNGTGVACLTDVNECESNQGARCSVNPRVECINLPGSFRCGRCPPGYEGDGYSCSDIDECLTIPNGGCSPMVACHNTIGSRICGSCPPGFQGDGVTCSWRGSCRINWGGCHPSAQCIDRLTLGGRTSQCLCPAGMDGDGVGLHGCYTSTGGNFTAGCETNPCGANGQCHSLRRGYTCICHRGYSGAHCDALTNSCEPNPCLNRGVCRPDDNTARGFRCECSAQYSGPLCQVMLKTCGGVLDAVDGSIIYPLSNTSYSHNARCAWVIHTTPDKVINITFSKFNLEKSPDCQYDFLQIHDGRSSASQLVGRFCGNNFPKDGNIISSHNNMYFWFRSDGSIAKDGFALHWTSINPVCGGEVDARAHGQISSPGSPGKYPPNRDCYWHLKTDLGKRIQLYFFALDIEQHANCSYDYLAIYDGEHSTDPLISKYCNSTQPAPVQSASSDLMIHFHSDAYGSGNGFQIVFSPVEGVPGCGGYFTSDKGEIVSPSFNGSYLNNLICEYKIKTSADTKIKIEFKSFKLERSFRCKFDYLKIYDGPSSDSRLVGRFCGNTYPKSYISSSNTLFFIFNSDHSTYSDGFRILYEAVCQITLEGDSGIIKSPGYPFNYPENKLCEYVISTTPAKAIQLTFQDFDIEDNTHYDCRYDYVEIRDGPNQNSTLLGKYCGGSEHTPPTKTSTHNYMYIRFKSDISISGTGFYANYTTINTECGGIYTKNTGLINYPSGDSDIYKNDQTCTWILIAPEGMHIKLTWNRFDIEKMQSCDSDYIELLEVDENDEINSLGKFCGTIAPPALTTSTNRLTMKFVSDSSIRSAGFSVSYAFLDEKSHCDGMLVKSHGFIYSPGWPNRYEHNRDCTWIITVPVGQQIVLNITQFDLERPIRNKCNLGDYLEIRNGATKNTPLIGQYCGRFQSKVVKSMTNILYLHFHSDFYLTGNGFKIEWDGTITGCGGTLTSSSGSISSPNYPSEYNENAECFYRIVTNPGSRIRITFADLDLERTSKCKDDYVEVYDGRDTSAASLGRHCSMSPGLTNIETSTNYAFIKFRSDFYIGAKGFLLNYNTICHNNVTGRYGVIESPDHPNNYPQSNCLWTINVPKGNKINLTFPHFDIFKPYRSRNWMISRTLNCGQDYLQWRELSDSGFSNKLCGNTPPPMITTRGNSLQIKFATSDFISRPGFRAEWVSYGCGGHIQKRSGSLTFDKNLMAAGETECEWLIETSIGSSVYLSITDLHVTDVKNCTIDAIEVYNGQNIKSPLISKTCNQGRLSVQSSANFMLVRFIKRSTLKDVYFKSWFDTIKSTCGGNFEALSGFIYSKNYPKNYDDNMDCMWIISVPMYHRIEINFLDLDLYSDFDFRDEPEDCGDSIKVYDNEYLMTSNYTHRICPHSNITQITTKYNRIMIQFVTDSSGTAKGFKANFTVTCGAFIKATTDGILSNDKFFSHSNRSCLWTILADTPDKKISLTITHMSLPKDNYLATNKSCSSAFLRVFDGNDNSAPLVDEYCGRKVPPMIVSHGSAITLELGTYSDIIAGDFAAHYSPLTTACGGRLTSEEGTIASPNYPRPYPVGSDCEWTLSTSPGNRVSVTFERFDLEFSEGCNEDYLELRENDGGGRLIDVYCGSHIPFNATTSSQLYIKFHSNDKNNGQGFLLHYGFLHGNDFIGVDNGVIASPLYPFSFHGAGEYEWHISTSGRESITITIDDLNIYSNSAICYNKLSVYDGFDDAAPLLGELCGILTEKEKVLKTSTSIAYIKLKTDESNSGALFHLTWTKTDINSDITNSGEKINCGSNHTELILPGQVESIQSPNYPQEYGDELNCEWVFKATVGYHLTLRFTDFKVEETSACFADSVSVYSSDAPAQWKPVKEKLCLSDIVNKDINSTNYMKVTFVTDSSISKKGFKGQVTSRCGGLITDLSGEVGPTWNDCHRGTETLFRIRCDWVIKVRPGRIIKLEFNHFNITNSDDKCITSVVLRNGDSAEAPMLANGKYCGYTHENRGEITTSSNSLFVSYRRDSLKFTYGIQPFQNFKIRYEEKNIECGVTSKLDIDHPWEVLNSPNYPAVPVSYSECVWIFSGPPGEILRIDFIDRFDLDDVDDCATEVVEIRDGSSELSPLKGRFCGERPGTIKTSGNAVYIKYLTQLLEPRNGFKANVSIDVCGGTIVADTGEITSPGYPHLQFLPYGSVCEWHIKGPPRFVFYFTPQDINLPESESPCATKVTFEETTPGNNTVNIIRTFCNDNVGDLAPIETSTNEVILKLYIGKPSEWNQISENKGFKFTFNTSKPMCGGYMTTPEGYLTTPGYPIETTLRFCQWLIKVPNKNRKIRVEILDTNAEKHRIGIYNDITFQSAIQIISNENSSPTTRIFESSGNKLALYLTLNPFATRHRFKAKFSSDDPALCGGDLSGLNGELLSPDIDRSYTCEWHYNNKANSDHTDLEYNTIYITAKINSSVTTSRCRYSDPKLHIRSIIKNRGGIFVRDICGSTEVSFRIPSSVIDFKAIKSQSSSLYFYLQWKSQPCGGIVHVGPNSVNILNIPNSYNGTLDCAWLIVTQIDARIELTMEGSFLLDCDNEFVKIGRGLSQHSPTIGDFCKSKTLEKPIVADFRNLYVEYHSNAKNNTNIKIMARTILNQCGGYLSSYERYFSSPNFPKNYDSNQECSWEITADIGNRISLQFIDRFVVEDRPNCTKDAVIIYDWKDDDYTQIARLCGRNIPIPYNSTNNRMKVVLRTDADTNLDGFKAQWTPICGGNYIATEKEQILYSPGYPYEYTPRLSCSYDISAPDGKKMYLKFLEFELEGNKPDCEYDNLTITGYNYYIYEIYCGSDLPLLKNSFEKVTLTLNTDNYIERKGFKLSFKLYSCGGQIKDTTVLSSNELDTYEGDLNCTWSIEAPENKMVVFKFLFIDLESHSECNYDYIAVFNGLAIDNNKRLALLCGHDNTTFVLKSNGNKALLQFVTDSSLNYGGFKVYILFTYSESVGCGGLIDLTTTTTRSIKSPLIASNVVYENFLDCHWTIKSPIDTVIKIEFSSFHISPCRDVNQTALGYSNCDCDLVEIKDGINPNSLVIGTYCGHSLPPILFSSKNVMTVRLSSDGEISSSGFEATVTAQRSVCGQSHFSVSNKIQSLKSPGYDTGSIPRGLHCVYHFETSSNSYIMYNLVQLSIINLDLQPSIEEAGIIRCNKDKLVITSYSLSPNTTVGKDFIISHEIDAFFHNVYSYNTMFHIPNQIELCGLKKSVDLYVSGSFTLNLITSPDTSKNFKGFEIEVVSAGFCGRNYTASQGKIQSAYENQIDYDSHKNCYTLITAPENHTISGYFISVSPEYGSDDCYLDIFDGDKTSSPKLIRIDSDYENDYPVFSTGRYMLLYNHQSDGAHVHFDMNYITTNKGRGCGGKLTNLLGKITSPMYPESYRQKSTCEWEIETPVGTRLNLHFAVFDLGRICDQNYLQLVDSKGNVISTYCSETPADYTSKDNYVKIVFVTSMNNSGSGWVAEFVSIK